MTAIIEATALVRRLKAAANILKEYPCEVYGLEHDCRDAATIIPLIRAAALEEAAKVAEGQAELVWEDDGPMQSTRIFHEREIAARIRTLKEQP